MFASEGGFGVTPGSGAGEKSTQKRSQNIIPVTIKQILDSSEDSLDIGGIRASLVKIVGIVKSIEPSSIKVVYQVEDNTGVMPVIEWLNDENDGEERSNTSVTENSYCRVIGTIRSNAGSKHLMIFSLQPVTDLSELTAHMLEIIFVQLKAERFEQGNPMVKKEPESFNGDSDIMMRNNDGGSTNGLNFNPQQQKVYSVLQQCTSENGCTPQDIFNALPVKIPLKDIQSIIDWLVCEGHVYSTIDDVHYKATY